MAWTPKPSAPAYFSLADAFLALITGDPEWGWLVDWLTLVPNTGVATAPFCAEGPIFADALVATDFIPSSNPLDPRKAVQTAALMYRISAAARDRVFGAYCEQLTDTGVGTWGAEITWVAPKSVADGTQVITNPRAFGAHATATSVRVRMLSGPIPSSSSQDYRIYHEPSGSVFASWNGGESTPTGYATHSWTNGDTIADISFTIAGGATYGISWNDGLSAEEHAPTDQPQPDGVTSPLRTVDPSLGGIASELERLEFKLDTLWPIVQSVAGATVDLGTPPIDPVDLVADTPLDVADAIGCVIAVSGIPSELDVGFGVPQRVARLGWVNLGTIDAWYPSIPLTHTPLVIRPFPPGTTRVSITQLPPGVSATVAMILPAK
jgi:hypothetical protein